LVVVLLYIAGTRVLAVGCQLMGFLSLWCHTVAEAIGRFCRLVAEGAGVIEFAFMMEV
jgi:hypothetical protein